MVSGSLTKLYVEPLAPGTPPLVPPIRRGAGARAVSDRRRRLSLDWDAADAVVIADDARRHERCPRIGSARRRAQGAVDPAADGRAAGAAARRLPRLSGRPASAAQLLQGRQSQPCALPPALRVVGLRRRAADHAEDLAVHDAALGHRRLSDRLSDLDGRQGEQGDPAVLGAALVLDQLPGARLRVGRAARPQRRRQPAARCRWASSISRQACSTASAACSSAWCTRCCRLRC